MKRTIEYIETIVCAGEYMDVESLHNPCRKQVFVEVRQLIMTLALKFENTQYSIEKYFDRGHPAAIIASNVVNGYCKIYPKWSQKVELYSGIIRDEKLYRYWEFETRIRLLKSNTNELINYLEKVIS